MIHVPFIFFLFNLAKKTGEMRKIIWFAALLIELYVYTDIQSSVTLAIAIILTGALGPIYLYLDKEYAQEVRMKYTEMEIEEQADNEDFMQK